MTKEHVMASPEDETPQPVTLPLPYPADEPVAQDAGAGVEA